MPNRGNRRGNRKGNKKGQKKGALQQRATRDVQLQIQPQLDSIDRAEERARNDYADFGAAAEGTYDALSNELAPLGGQYQTQSDAISSGLGTSLSQLAQQIGLSNMDTPDAETAAGLGAYGSIGQTGLSQLANNASRNLGYQTSAQRQGAIEREEVSRNLLQDLQDALEGYGERRLDVTGQQGEMFKQRLDELRDQSITQQLARSQMASEEAMSQYLQDTIGGTLSGLGGGGGFDGGGGGRPGGGGGGGPSGPPPRREVGPGFGSDGESIPRGNNPPPDNTVMQWLQRKVRNINQTDDYGDIPGWLQRMYEYGPPPGPDRWAYAQANLKPRQRQIWRRTRPHVQDVFDRRFGG